MAAMSATDAQPSPPTRFGHADLQLHTAYGDGMAAASELLDYVQSRTDLDVIAITDHDSIEGALLAREVHARGRYRFELMTGIEVTTRSGHLLAIDVTRPIRSLRPLDQTIAEIHRQGGIAIIPHPFSYLTRSVGQRALERVLAQHDAETRPDAIEVANTTLAGRVTGGKARRLNRERYGLAETGGSDAHFLQAVGTAATLFWGRTAADVRQAIAQGTTRGLWREGPSLRRLGLRLLARQQLRGLAVTPRTLLGPPLRRIARRARTVAQR